jgi:hypothetical protein
MNIPIQVLLKEGVKPSRVQLDILISSLEVSTPEADRNSYEKLTSLLNEKFDCEVTLDDIVNHYAVEIETEDRKLIYKNAGLI